MKKYILVVIALICSFLSDNMAFATDTNLYGSFTGGGIWKWDGSSWSQVTPNIPQLMVISGSNLYGSFAGAGIWKWDGSSWVQITPNNPQLMVISGSNLYGSFAGAGIWKWDGSSWMQVTPNNPQLMVTSGANLYGAFAGNGIWKYDGSAWSNITSSNPVAIAASGSNLYGTFAGNGVWQWNGSTWIQLTPNDSVSMLAPLSSKKAITSFSFANPVASAAIDEGAKTISIILPYNTNVSALIATFTTTGLSVKVGSTMQVTGTTQNDFTNPVFYTVTAEDNSTVTYTVTVTCPMFLDYVVIPTGSWPEAVAIGDVNNDGRNDVVLTTSYNNDAANDYKIFVFLQNAAGGLDPPVKYATSCSYGNRPETVAIGDINNDGRNDVVIGCSGSGIEVFLQNNSGTLNSGIFYTSNDSNKIRIADLNNDGLLDIVGIGWGTNTASVWLQNSSGTLNSPVVYNVTHGGYDDLEVGDVNNDGLTDIIVMSGQGLNPNLGVLTQKPNGTFNAPVYYSVSNPVTANTLTHGVAVGDINGDHLNDIVVTYGGNSPYANIGVFSQNTSGTLNPVASYSSLDCPEPIEIADVTGDGRKDIIVLHGGWNAVGIYQQSASGMLQSEKLYPIPYASHYNPHGLAVGDINSSGLKDIVIADYNNGLVILYGN